ncbi:MAG: GTP cyclohydrolase I FolE [Endozoicomonadaceae bacterium]|nr:GTP cyclohydrolase I FolE [Endozoicomonadaceae bacterium]
MSLADHYHCILKEIGEDPERPELLNTPQRAEKAMKEMTAGYSQSLLDITNGALFNCNTDEMVIINNIELYSTCEHHLLPFIGKCHIGYLPNKKILGLSKFARIVDMFARRLQVQERLTQEIATNIQEITQAKGVAVCIQSQHLCMLMRGIKKQNASMTTSVMLGSFRTNPATRTEFMQYITTFQH